MAPGHTLSVDAPRPHTSHTSKRWPQATDFNLMAPGHTLGVIWPYLKYMWPGAIHLKCVAWSDQLKGVWPGAIYLKCVAWGHQLKLCGLGAYLMKSVA